MKKTYKYAVVGLLFLFLAGCEDFLDKREDSGGLTEEAVYSSTSWHLHRNLPYPTNNGTWHL